MADASDGAEARQDRLRLCLSCRQYKTLPALCRLTVDFATGNVVLKQPADKISGRSAYICRNIQCLERALKGTRLKSALEGGKGKAPAARRRVAWPLEPQLIHTLRRSYTESPETCQNTLREEGI